MEDSLLFFNPYIGDTILATALADKFSDHFEETTYVASISEEMRKLTDTMGGYGFHYHNLSKFIEEGSKVGIPLVKEYLGGADFGYSFSTNKEEEKRIKALCEDIIYDLEPTFRKFYILHYSYAFAKLGQVARKEGFEVWGYCLDEQNRLYFSKGETACEVPSIWSKGFIGDRLSNIVTGSPLARENYATYLTRKGFRYGACIFPTTRGKQVSAENWFMDYEVLKRLEVGHLTHWHESEPRPPYSFRFGSSFSSLAEMIKHIETAEFIICYDSASFHLAWLTDTPAIVKLKGGFNEEWIPSWVKDNPNYYFIPSNVMYEEEYVGYLNEGLRQLGVIR